MNRRIGIYICIIVSVLYPYIMIAGKCTGSSNCRACSSCNYCKHCNSMGGTCGVCESHVSSGAGGTIGLWIVGIGLVYAIISAIAKSRNE